DELEQSQDRPVADGDRDEDWGLDEPAPAASTPASNTDAEDSGVYDADYRVIIPPYRPIDGEDENENTNDRDLTS
ncbi:MAG: hypothetical protein AAFW75_27315, partial [Cyanobacteria bacterium J06636_16]